MENKEEDPDGQKKQTFLGNTRVAKEIAQEAHIAVLERCVGRHGGAVMTRLKPFVQEVEKIKLQHAKAEDTELFYFDTKTCMEGIDKKKQKRISPAEQRALNQRDKREVIVAKAYLGKMSQQRTWLKKLSENETNGNLRELAGQAFNEIDQYYWTMRENKPLYHLQHKYRRCEPIRNKQHVILRDKKQEIMTSEIERMFENLHRFREKRLAKKCADEAHKIKLLLERTPLQMVKEKNGFVVKLATLMGDIYMDRKVCSPQLSVKENQLRIKCAFGMDDTYNSMGVDSTIQGSDFPFYNNKTWREDYNKFLSVSDCEIDRAWIHHELGRTYMLERKWGHLVAQGYKCVESGKKCESIAWQINGLFLVAVGASKRRDYDEAMEAINEGLEIAKKAEKYRILEGLDVAKAELKKRDRQRRLPQLNTNALIKKREEEIVKLMRNDPQKQANVRDLLSRMRALPQKRRMSIVPGIGPKETGNEPTQDRSIIPGGCGGRLGMYPVTDMDFWEFAEVKKPAGATYHC